MGALALGALAALCWGVHDLCVRRVSRRAHIPSCLLVVLVVGALAQLPLLALGGGSGEEGTSFSPRTLATMLATGVAFTVASYALYRAFAAGPVRIVAPVVGAYPLATTAFATAGGASFGAGHWVAVLAIVAGVALVAAGTNAAGANAAGTKAASTSAAHAGARSTDAFPDDVIGGARAARAGGVHGSEAVDAEREAPFALGPALAWSLMSALAFATTFSLGQALAGSHDPAAVSLGTRVCACLALGLCLAPTRAWRVPARADWPVLALMGVLDATALGAVLLAGRLPDAVLASVTASLFGVVTIVLARVFLAEAMSARQWLGVATAFTAIGWLSAV